MCTLEDGLFKTVQSRKQNRKKKSEERTGDSCDTIKLNNMFIMEVPEGGEKERARKSI